MMPKPVDAGSIDSWLTDVREHVLKQAPELLPTLDIYIGEARFGRQFIAEDLRRLPPGAEVLEVGAGPMLLSCQLVREGYRVAALEPLGPGFSHFERLRELVMRQAEASNCRPCVIDQPAETLAERESFDFAFSINVMEHVRDVALTIYNVGISLKPGASYRFTCPNYLFPYEPHFNIPTLFSKRLTEALFRKRILQCKGMVDAEEVWNSLNWISVGQIKAAVREMPAFKVVFNRHQLVVVFERIMNDPNFARRRGMLLRVAMMTFVRLHLHSLLRFIPAALQPIIDCRLVHTRA